MIRAWWHVVLGGLSCSLLSPCFAAPGAPQCGTFDLFTAAEVSAWNALPCPPPTGIKVTGAQLPSGHHHLLMR
jgi:hypothetical protein